MKRSPGHFWVILLSCILLTPSGVLSKTSQSLEPAQQGKESINPHGSGLGPDSIAPPRFLEDDPPPLNYFTRSGPTVTRKLPAPPAHQIASSQEATQKHAPHNPQLISRIVKPQVSLVEIQGQVIDPAVRFFAKTFGGALLTDKNEMGAGPLSVDSLGMSAGISDRCLLSCLSPFEYDFWPTLAVTWTKNFKMLAQITLKPSM